MNHMGELQLQTLKKECKLSLMAQNELLLRDPSWDPLKVNRQVSFCNFRPKNKAS